MASYKPGITLQELSWDIASNTSVVRASYWVESTGGAYSNYSSNGATNLGGNVENFTRSSFSFKPSGTNVRVTLVERTVTIGHNVDGTGSCYAEFWWASGHSDIGTVSKIETITLTTIPRATACPNLSGNIESSYNIALNPASSGFGHSIYASFGSIGGYINGSGNLQSDEYIFWNNFNIPFTIPSSYYSQFGGQNDVGNLRLWTYSGGTRIGESYGSLTAYCLESRCRPSISGTVKDCNEITKALTGDENKLVKYFSNALLNLNIKATTTNNDTNSSVSSKYVDGTSFTGNSVTLNKITKKDFTITVSNSRGFSTSFILSLSGNLINYFPPSITINPYRYPDQTSSQIKLSYSGTFFNQNFGNVQNEIIMKWYWRKSKENVWIFGGEITPEIENNSIKEGSIDCGNIFDYQEAFRFKVEIIDKVTNEGTKEADVTRGIPIYSHGKDFFQFHVPIYDKTSCLVNNQYSMEELKIGIWDDSLPLYRKIIKKSDSVDSGTINIPHNISNLDKIVNIYGYALDSDSDYKYVINSRISSDGSSIGIQGYNSNHLRLYISPNFGNRIFDLNIVIEYTKTIN